MIGAAEYALTQGYHRHPAGYGGWWKRHTGGGSQSVSDAGMDELLIIHRILQHWSGHLAALRDVLGGRCLEHGEDLDAMGWDVNTYDCDPQVDPHHVEFILWGWHDETDRFCVAARVRSVPGGLILWSRD